MCLLSYMVHVFITTDIIMQTLRKERMQQSTFVVVAAVAAENRAHNDHNDRHKLYRGNMENCMNNLF